MCASFPTSLDYNTYHPQCQIAAPLLLVSAWVRYAGTVRGIPVNGSYALLIIGQVCSRNYIPKSSITLPLFYSQFFASIAQPVFQIMGPIYSETWFDLKGRTTATMIVAIGITSPTFS
jgi:MFS transporter, FLVCR family, MFS-domain-containing protein 7